MKRKLIPFFIAVFFIIIIGGAAFAKVVYDKYSYGKEQADLSEYFQVSGDAVAIILQDEQVEEKALRRDGVVYLDLDTVHKYLNEIFYLDRNEKLLLYTTAVGTTRVNVGESSYVTPDGSVDAGYQICFLEDDVLYLALDFIKLYTNFSYELHDLHMQVNTEWGEREVATIQKKTAVRLRGGVKSPILREVERDEVVEVLEQMDTWSKVKTSDSMIGYVENKRLSEITIEEETLVTDYVEPEYRSKMLDEQGTKVSLGWHAIGGIGGNDTLAEVVSNTRGMNVIAPTWFSLNDEEGNFRSFASPSYVQKAHAMGLQVWAVLDDFNYNNETKADISVQEILSTTTKRQQLVQTAVQAAMAAGVDGLNIDFERVTAECGPHYVQFLRELSVLCREKQLVLSVDNYVPFHFNDYYRLDIQGEIVDYVIIMGYDEHWHGSGDAGSVASIDYVSNGIDRTLEEVPAEKVINALPFYTILWKTQGDTVTDSYLTLRNTADFMQRVSAEPVWDEETCQNYMEWTEGQTTYQMWVEDAESISVKLNVMNTKGIGGVAAWRLGYGTTEIWELIKAYVNS